MFLDEACAGRPELRQRVEQPLGLNDGAGNFLERAAAEIVATIDNSGTEWVGKMIGPYTLLEQIGEGGMGAVCFSDHID